MPDHICDLQKVYRLFDEPREGAIELGRRSFLLRCPLLGKDGALLVTIAAAIVRWAAAIARWAAAIAR